MAMGNIPGKSYYRPRRFRSTSKSRKPEFRKSFRKKRRLLRRYLGSKAFLFLAGFSAFFLLLYVVFLSDLFSIQDVEVKVMAQGKKLDAAVLTQEVRKRFLGKNLLFVSASKLFFLSEDPTVKEFSLKKQWPNKFEVHVSRRVGKAILLDSKGAEFLVDEEGVVFASAGDADLPVISYPSKNLAIGDKVQGREVGFVLAVLSSCAESSLEVESVRAAGKVVVEFSTGPQVVLPLEEDAIAKMIDMVQQFHAREEPVSKIDLRFKNPVVEYN